MSLSDAVIARALELAVDRIGIKETTRNRGDAIDDWIRRVGLDPAGKHSWCVAFLWCCFDDACGEHGIRTPIPRTGKVIRLWQRAPVFYRIAEPKPGALYLHAVDPKDPDTAGHIGIVELVPDDKVIVGVEGNTDDEGGREGVEVARRQRKRSYVNLGYLWFGGPLPLPPEPWKGVPFR